MAHQGSDSEARFVSYVEVLADVVGDARRVEPLKHYCSGLLTAEGRKSVEPIAAVTAPASVSVQHQYCGQLGKQANCQVVVTLSVTNHRASLPIAYRLYLPQEWTEDAARRKKTRIPDNLVFKTKPEIALEQIRAACEAGVPPGVVLMDPAYGCHLPLRTGIRKLGLKYVAGISYNVKVLAAPKRGEPARMSVKDVALKLPRHAWRTIT